MKILLCSKYDLVGNMMLNIMLPRLAPHHEVTVILANRKRPETDAITELKWLSLFEQELPARLLFPLLDSMTARTTPAEPTAPWRSFAQLGEQHRVNIRTAGHIAHHSVLTAMVQEAAPDLIVSFQFGFIFKPEALACAKRGGLNLHSGALPERAGVNPTFWCMKDGDREAACSLHWLTAHIDAGDIAAVRRMPIDYTRSFFANWIENYQNGAEMICEAVETIERGESLASTPQDPAAIRFVPKPTQDDYRSFFASGRRLIDPQDCLDLIARYLPPPGGSTP
jgi:folate-dependent phosphoribosylglycinamide formyltransferase PurN